MLELTDIILHNWHRFDHHHLRTRGSLFLTGHNGSGKSTVLDAIQMALVADLTRVRFNSSAQEKSSRNLDSYVRGKIGEERYLRPGDTVGYVILRFRERHSDWDAETESAESEGQQARTVTLGICIEASERRPPEKSYFLVEGEFETTGLCSEETALNRKQLRQAFKSSAKLKGCRKAMVFDSAREYQAEMLKALGKLPARFLDVFVRALTFQPIRDIRLFVEQWLLDPSPLDLLDLNTVTQRLADLRGHVERAEHQIVALEEIESVRAQAKSQQQFARDHSLLSLVAKQASCSLREKNLKAEITSYEAHQAQAVAQLEANKVRSRELQQKLIGLQSALQQDDTARRLQSLNELIARLTKQQSHRESLEAKLLALWHRLVNGLNAELFPQLAKLIEKRGERSEGGFTIEERIQEVREGIPLVRQEVQAWSAQRTRLSDTVQQHMTRVREIEKSLREATSNRRVSWPAHLDKARELLSAHLRQPVSFLCEHIEIQDEAWHDAVEAVLGPRRFALVLSDASQLHQAQKFLRVLRRDHHLTDISVLHLERIKHETRPAQAGSLAEHVSCQNLALERYVKHVLGQTICVDEVDQLENHKRAITQDCVLYAEWTTRSLDLRRVRPWRCGARALSSQIDALKVELSAAEAAGREALDLFQRWESGSELAEKTPDLVALLARCDDLPAAHQLSHELSEAETEKAAIDTSAFQELADLVAKTRSDLEATQLEYEEKSRVAAESQSRLRLAESELQQICEDSRQIQQQCESAREQNMAEYESALEALSLRIAENEEATETVESLGIISRNADIAAKGFETKFNRMRERLIEAATAYNLKYDFAAISSDLQEIRYDRELLRIRSSALPEFRDAIAEQSRKAEEELQEHILHRLRERILDAKSALERLNRGLRNLKFREESYRFKWYPAAEIREFYDLVMHSTSIGSQALQDSSYYQERQQTFERFYDILTMTPQTEEERQWQESLTDYRTYLTYDIEVTHASGQVSRLSKIVGQTSGGETQTPFYIAIAASFLQIYEERSKASGLPTPRLVVFDEAFSKMDQDRIASTVGVFHSFGLQVITATPLERCEYLAPRMQTSLVLTGIEDSVHVEPYENYLKLLSRSQDATI